MRSIEGRWRLAEVNNGKPGICAEYSAGYYAAFVIDPDGYRIEAHCEAATP